MLDDSDDIDTISHAAQDAREAFNDVLAQRPSKPQKPPRHPKYDFRAAIQASRDLKGATKLVGLLLADYINVDHGYAFPTVTKIMENLGMPETTVHRALRNLQDLTEKDSITGEVRIIAPGWFRREATKGKNGADLRNHWHPIYARAGLAEHDRVGCQNDRGGCHERHPRVPSTAPLILTGYQPDSLIGDGIATLTVPLISESKNPSGSAAAQQQGERLVSASRDGNKTKAHRQPVEVIALPDGCPFDSDGIAKRSDLTADDITAAEASFREKTAGQMRTPAEWKRTAAAWIKLQKSTRVHADASGTLFPENFVVTPELVGKATALGLTRGEVQEAFSAFAEHYQSVTGFRAYSRDWNGTWMAWMRRAATEKKRGLPPKKSAI